MSYPGDEDYCWQSEGNPCEIHSGHTCYFVCNLDQEILIDLKDINSSASQPVILDAQNLLLPIKSNDHPWNN